MGSESSTGIEASDRRNEFCGCSGSGDFVCRWPQKRVFYRVFGPVSDSLDDCLDFRQGFMLGKKGKNYRSGNDFRLRRLHRTALFCCRFY
jgi:hypothetical protein